MRVTIKRTDVAHRSGTGQNNKPWSMSEQQGYAHTTNKEGVADEYPQKVTIRLGDGVKPYEPGEYEVAPQSYFVGQYGRLTLGDLVLLPAGKTPSVKP